MLITHPPSSTLLRGAFVATVTADRDPRITQMDYFLKLFDKTHTEGIFTEVPRREVLGTSYTEMWMGAVFETIMGRVLV
jgi:hypothetical protein